LRKQITVHLQKTSRKNDKKKSLQLGGISFDMNDRLFQFDRFIFLIGLECSLLGFVYRSVIGSKIEIKKTFTSPLQIPPKKERESKTGVLNSRYTNQPNLLLQYQRYWNFRIMQRSSPKNLKPHFFSFKRLMPLE